MDTETPATVYQLALMPEQGAWGLFVVGVFGDEADAWVWVRAAYPEKDERELRYLFSVTPMEVGEGKRVPWWDR